jgi:catechol-2,3-dioxygenase
MMAKAKGAGVEVRGISDHYFIDSIYLRDPNGYVIELTAKRPNHDQAMDPAANEARAKLDRWQAAKRAAR